MLAQWGFKRFHPSFFSGMWLEPPFGAWCQRSQGHQAPGSREEGSGRQCPSAAALPAVTSPPSLATRVQPGHLRDQAGPAQQSQEAASRVSGPPAGLWPPGGHATRKLCWNTHQLEMRSHTPLFSPTAAPACPRLSGEMEIAGTLSPLGFSLGRRRSCSSSSGAGWDRALWGEEDPGHACSPAG